MEFIRAGLELRSILTLGRALVPCEFQFLHLLFGIITLILSKFQDSWEGYT